jgi:hypothetical protein
MGILIHLLSFVVYVLLPAAAFLVLLRFGYHLFLRPLLRLRRLNRLRYYREWRAACRADQAEDEPALPPETKDPS